MKPSGMTRWRVIMVHVILALILAGSSYAVVTQREIWPFSPYPMYSWIEKNRSVRRLQLYGITQEARPQEFPLVALEHLQPLDDARLYVALRRLQRQTNSKQALQETLADMLLRYENLRRSGRHTGPPLQGIRLYQLVWFKIDPGNFKQQGPDRRKLLSEVKGTEQP